MSDGYAIDMELGSNGLTLPQAGAVLGGKYRLTRRLGQGGMGAIYEAEHVKLLQRVAVKFLRPDAASNDTLRERFFREARSLAKIRSPNVCAVFDVDETDTQIPYIVMELLDGKDLAQVVRDEPNTPMRTRVDWAIQAAEGLAEAHQLGIIHRDVKPANLMLVIHGGRTIVKVVDFGIAREITADTTDLTSGVAIGTPRYMSPEQLAGDKVDQRSDVWSLGIALYNLLSQRMPFDANDTTSLVTAVLTREPTPLPTILSSMEPALWNVIAWALRKRIADRPASMSEWADALRPFGTAATPSSVVVPPALSHPSGRRRQKQNVIITVAFAVVALVGIGVFFALKANPPVQPPAPVAVTEPVVVTEPVAAPVVPVAAPVAPVVAPPVAQVVMEPPPQPTNVVTPPTPTRVITAANPITRGTPIARPVPPKFVAPKKAPITAPPPPVEPTPLNPKHL